MEIKTAAQMRARITESFSEGIVEFAKEAGFTEEELAKVAGFIQEKLTEASQQSK